MVFVDGNYRPGDSRIKSARLFNDISKELGTVYSLKGRKNVLGRIALDILRRKYSPGCDEFLESRGIFYMNDPFRVEFEVKYRTMKALLFDERI